MAQRPSEQALLLALAEEAMKRFVVIRDRQRQHVQDWNAAMVRAAEAVFAARRR